jgi:hypothetical protein
MATLQKYSGLIQSKGLDNLLRPYMDKPLTWFVAKKQEISRVFNDEIGLDRVGPIITTVWDIINPNFGTGIDEGYVKDATYIAIIYAVIRGEDGLLRNTFTRSIANVDGKVRSVGRVIGTATIKSKLLSALSGGRRRTYKRRGTRRVRRVPRTRRR